MITAIERGENMETKAHFLTTSARRNLDFGAYSTREAFYRNSAQLLGGVREGLAVPDYSVYYANHELHVAEFDLKAGLKKIRGERTRRSAQAAKARRFREQQAKEESWAEVEEHGVMDEREVKISVDTAELWGDGNNNGDDVAGVIPRNSFSVAGNWEIPNTGVWCHSGRGVLSISLPRTACCPSVCKRTCHIWVFLVSEQTSAVKRLLGASAAGFPHLSQAEKL